MTFNDLINDVVGDLDEDKSDSDVLTKVKRYINRGYIELAKKECLEKVKTSTVVGGKVACPVGMIRLYHVLEDGTPIPFEVRGKYIYCDSDTVQIVYSYIPELLEGLDDETETNPANDEFIVNYAKWKFSEYDGMMDNAIYYRNLVDSHKVIIQSRIVKTIDVWG